MFLLTFGTTLRPLVQRSICFLNNTVLYTYYTTRFFLNCVSAVRTWSLSRRSLISPNFLRRRRNDCKRTTTTRFLAFDYFREERSLHADAFFTRRQKYIVILLKSLACRSRRSPGSTTSARTRSRRRRTPRSARRSRS